MKWNVLKLWFLEENKGSIIDQFLSHFVNLQYMDV